MSSERVFGRRAASGGWRAAVRARELCHARTNIHNKRTNYYDDVWSWSRGSAGERHGGVVVVRRGLVRAQLRHSDVHDVVLRLLQLHALRRLHVVAQARRRAARRLHCHTNRSLYFTTTRNCHTSQKLSE